MMEDLVISYKVSEEKELVLRGTEEGYFFLIKRNNGYADLYLCEIENGTRVFQFSKDGEEFGIMADASKYTLHNTLSSYLERGWKIESISPTEFFEAFKHVSKKLVFLKKFIK